MTSGGTRNHVKSSIVPFAAIAVVVVAVQLAYEFDLPPEGVARQDALDNGHAWLVRLASAAVLSLATLLLVWGLSRDRAVVRSRDDRIAGEYFAAGLLTMIVCTFCGAVPGLVVGAGVAGCVPFLRGRSSEVLGAPARDARNVAFVAIVANLLLLGARESYATYLQWDKGYGVTAAQEKAFADDHGGQLVITIALVVAVVAALLLPAAVWRHRRRITAKSELRGQLSVRALFLWTAFAVAALSLIAQNWAGVAIGLICVPLILVFAHWARKEAER